MSNQLLDKGLTGIVNMGNTCYMNSVIQILVHNIDLLNYYLDKKYLQDLNNTDEVAFSKEFFRLCAGMWEENCTVQPESFKVTLDKFYDRYVGFHQHDSHECLVAILDLLHLGVCYKATISYSGSSKNSNDKLAIEAIKNWNSNFNKSYSYIVKSYYGQYLSSLKCTKCNYVSNTFQPFNVLDIPVKRGNNITLEKLLDNYLKLNTLDNDNMWRCDECKVENNAQKEIKLWTLPSHLIIKFNRFDNMNMKITSTIEFPIDSLNMEPYSTNYFCNNTDYELYGVINHFGATNGGHYTSYCKNIDKQWYHYNDDSVSEIDESKLITSAAYILFYKRL